MYPLGGSKIHLVAMNSIQYGIPIIFDIVFLM